MKKLFTWAAVSALVIGLIAEPLAAQRGGGNGGGNRGGGGGGGGARAGGGGGGARVGGGGGGFSGGGSARIGGGGASVGGARISGGGVNVGGARVGGGAAAAPRVQSAPQVRSNAGGINLGGSSSGRITTGRPNIDLGSRTGVDARVGGTRAGADVNVRSRAGADVSDRVRGTLDGRVGGNLDARVRSGAVDGRADARTGGSRADRVGNFLDIDPRAGADVRARTGADVGARTRGNLDARARVDSDVRTNLRASWANNIRLNDNVSRNLANAFQTAARAQAGVDGRGDSDGRRNGDWNRWDRDGRYGNWATNTRGYWGRNGYPYFGSGWWGNYGFNRPYGYFNYYYGRPYGYWWGQPNFVGFNRWFGWGGWNGWNTPYYYTYGPSGYVVYQDDGVYVGNQYVGTPEVYAASAAQLAAIDPNQIPADQQGEWMPLGTFAFVTSDEEAEEPSRFLQLAVDQNGLISGTMFNENREQAYSVEGRVDKDTQRVAFTISNNRDIVFETGIYNLTQDETQLLAHFSPDDTRTFLLVRLEQPEEGAEELEAEARMAERPSR